MEENEFNSASASASASASDEEDDRHILIPTTTTNPNPNPNSTPSPQPFSTAFNILRSFTINHPLPILFFIFLLLPLSIFIFYFHFSTHTNNLIFNFQTPTPTTPTLNSNPQFHSSTLNKHIQALLLLRKQQLGLFNLFNNTLSNFTIPFHYSFNSTSTNSNSHHLASQLLTQISINNQVQQLLLSSHQQPYSPTFHEYTCLKVDHMFSNKRTIQWKPKANKYLFAICVSGQMSNHLICLQKHMFFAAVLHRVLVIPSSKVDYEFNRILDVDHINKCLGRQVVATFKEFALKKKNHLHLHLHIDRVICYFSLPQPCYVDNDHVKKLKSLGVSMSKLEPAWVEDVKKPSKRTVQDVVAKFSCNDDVIAIGDVFFADVEKEWVMQPGGPIAHKCMTLIEPSRLIRLTAQRFIQTFLGENFIALHFHRHGFLKFCNAKRPSCFFPIPQAAGCINHVIKKANTPVIYLSTDAAESETDLLQSLLVLNGRPVPLVKRPPRNSAEKWDALLYRHGLGEDSQVEAMLDKTISAMSKVFIGSSGSTFTEDILRLRKDWGSASLCDEYLCHGETPNFITGDE